MNSRDAAYEEQVKAAMEASRMEAVVPELAIEDGEEEPSAALPAEPEDDIEEKAPARKAKRKREEEDNGQ